MVAAFCRCFILYTALVVVVSYIDLMPPARCAIHARAQATLTRCRKVLRKQFGTRF